MSGLNVCSACVLQRDSVANKIRWMNREGSCKKNEEISREKWLYFRKIVKCSKISFAFQPKKIEQFRNRTMPNVISVVKNTFRHFCLNEIVDKILLNEISEYASIWIYLRVFGGYPVNLKIHLLLYFEKEQFKVQHLREVQFLFIVKQEPI